jgi:hypothetical protein
MGGPLAPEASKPLNILLSNEGGQSPFNSRLLRRVHCAKGSLVRWKVEVAGHECDVPDLGVAVRGLGASAFRDGDKTFLYHRRIRANGARPVKIDARNSGMSPRPPAFR